MKFIWLIRAFGLRLISRRVWGEIDRRNALYEKLSSKKLLYLPILVYFAIYAVLGIWLESISEESLLALGSSVLFWIIWLPIALILIHHPMVYALAILWFTKQTCGDYFRTDRFDMLRLADIRTRDIFGSIGTVVSSTYLPVYLLVVMAMLAHNIVLSIAALEYEPATGEIAGIALAVVGTLIWYLLSRLSLDMVLVASFRKSFGLKMWLWPILFGLLYGGMILGVGVPLIILALLEEFAGNYVLMLAATLVLCVIGLLIVWIACRWFEKMTARKLDELVEHIENQ